MFGFGRSSADNEILGYTEGLLAAFSDLRVDVKPMAQKLVREVKADMRKIGDDSFIYDASFGDRAVANEVFMKPRLAEGLTYDNVRTYWNRPQLAIFMELKVREFGAFVAMDVARQHGKDLIAVARQLRKMTPQYGDPISWDQKHPANEVFTQVDTDLYAEFVGRVGRWQVDTPQSDQQSLLNKYSSFNSLV